MNTRLPFDEEKQTDHEDPLDAHNHTDFDFDELSRRLGEPEDSELSKRDDVALGIALKRVLQYLSDGRSVKAVGRRTLALAWVVDPSIFEGSPSLTKLAKRYKMHKAVLSEDTAAISREFSIKNRAQAHGWNRKNQIPEVKNVAHN